MILFPPAKINIGLSIIGKRKDGYHDIETVLLAIGLCDALEVITPHPPHNLNLNPTGDLSASRVRDFASLSLNLNLNLNLKHYLAESANFYRTGLAYPATPEHDLVEQARRAAAHHIERMGGRLPHTIAHLHKCIPSGSGLGGGSSDAAAKLWLLSRLAPDQLTPEACMMLAASIGSDCSFFMRILFDGASKTRTAPVAMLATGRGDVLKPIEIPSLSDKYMVLVCPPIHISTSESYRNISPTGISGSVAEAVSHPMAHWPELLKNDFEAHAMLNHPTIHHIKEKLYELGACFASMSGSGAAVYGLFDDEPAADLANTFPACFTWAQHI